MKKFKWLVACRQGIRNMFEKYAPITRGVAKNAQSWLRQHRTSVGLGIGTSIIGSIIYGVMGRSGHEIIANATDNSPGRVRSIDFNSSAADAELADLRARKWNVLINSMQYVNLDGHSDRLMEIIPTFVKLVSSSGNQHALVQLELACSLIRTGLDIEEAWPSASIQRYLINLSENDRPISENTVDLIRILTLAASGAPLK